MSDKQGTTCGRRRRKARGFTLIEVAVSMIIVSVMLVAALTTMGATARSRRSHYDAGRATTLAHALLAEIIQQRYEDPDSGATFGREAGEVLADRRTWDDVDDYDGLINDPPRAEDGQPMDDFAGYRRTVSVTVVDPATLLASGAASDSGVRLVEVTVVGPSGRAATVSALRTEHSTLEQTPTLDTAYITRVGVELQLGPEPNGLVSGGVAVLNHRPVAPPGTGGRAVRERRLRRRVGARRGSTYLAVLLVSMIVTIIGLTGLTAEHLRLKASSRERDWAVAQVLAASAIEHGLHFIATQSTTAGWRTAVKDADADVGPVLELGGGTVQWFLRNHQDHAMSSDPAKPIYLVGTATYGRAQHTLQIIVRPAGPAYSGLTVPIFADRDIDFNPAPVVVQADGPIVSNDDIKASGCGLFATEFRAADKIEGGTYFGVTLPSSAPLGLPADPFDYYETYGTVIAGADLPPGNGGRVIRDVVLSPNSNPYGAETNPEGIYFIDADGDDVTIERSRMLGTLVIDKLGLHGKVIITGSVLLEPALAGHPALLVDGDLTLECSSIPLSEAMTGANFNPGGTPFAGVEDTLLDDDYPSLIRGLVFCDQDVTLAGDHTTIEGLLLADGKIKSKIGSADAVLEVTFDPDIAENPPPGFFLPDGTVRIGAFSWSQVDP